MKKRAFYSNIGILFGGALSLISSSALAYDGEVTGTVDTIFIKSGSTTQSLIVTLDGTPDLCGQTGKSSAKMAHDQIAFSEVVRVLLAAKLAGKQVKLYSDYDSASDFCVLKLVKLL